MKYSDEQINAILENMTKYHLMLQYLREFVDDETWERSKEYSKDFFEDIEVEVSDDELDDDEYENYIDE